MVLSADQLIVFHAQAFQIIRFIYTRAFNRILIAIDYFHDYVCASHSLIASQ